MTEGSRFDPFEQKELALMAMGFAALVAVYVSDTEDREERVKTAKLALDMIDLMDELGRAEAWGGDDPVAQASSIDPSLREALQGIVDAA